MDRPRNTVVIDRFGGLVSNRGRFPKQPGDASVMENVRVARDGEVCTRKGTRAVVTSGVGVKMMFYAEFPEPTVFYQVGGTVYSKEV